MLYKKAGYLTLGSRLKRLGERALSEVRVVYRQADVDFETSWFPVFFVISEKGMCSMQELSEQLEVSHSAISQLITQLERRELISIRISAEDQRRKEIILTDQGMALMERVLPIWRAFEISFREHLGTNVLETLNRVEEALDSGKISSTAIDVMKDSGEMEIRDGEESEKEISDFMAENGLEYHEGSMFVCLYWSDRIVGVLCYRPEEDHFELESFFISPSFRRRGFGGQMLARIVEKYGPRPFVMRQSSTELLQLLHKEGHSFMVNMMNTN